MVPVQVPKGSAGYYMLGRICGLTNRHRAAVSYQRAALTLDPLMWCAYEELCALGECLRRHYGGTVQISIQSVVVEFDFALGLSPANQRQAGQHLPRWWFVSSSAAYLSAAAQQDA